MNINEFIIQCQNVIQPMSMNDGDSTGISMFRNQLIFIFCCVQQQVRAS